MYPKNTVTLITELTNTFVSEVKCDLSTTFIKNLKKKFLTNLFAFRNRCNDSYDVSMNNSFFQIRVELLSHFLKYYHNSGNFKYNINLICLQFDNLFTYCQDNDLLNSLLFLYFLTDLKNHENSCYCYNNLNSLRPLHLEFNVEEIDWKMFNIEPIEILWDNEYPFYNPPGTNISFIEEFCVKYDYNDNYFTKFYKTNDKVNESKLNEESVITLQVNNFPVKSEYFSKIKAIETPTASRHLNHSYEFLNTKDVKQCKQTWEELRSHECNNELPFISETSNFIVHFWKIANLSQNLLTKTIPVGVQINYNLLKIDLEYLLFGITSSSFFFNSITRSFSIRNNLHLDTITPETLSDFCQSFLECAYFYYSLKSFVNKRLMLEFGVIHKIFFRSIKQALDTYVFCLLNLKWNSILLMSQFDYVISPLKQKLAFLANLCFIKMEQDSASIPFPSSIYLLDYLYDNLMKIYRTDLSSILFHIFESCCNIYLKIVSEWIFNGSFSNPENYNEFFIEIERENEICRDWRRVNCIKLIKKSVPKFLDKFHESIFICGKTVNLLKICSSEEILNDVFPKNYPSLKCCFNLKQIKKYSYKWQTFDKFNKRNLNVTAIVEEKLCKKYDTVEFLTKVAHIRQDWFAQFEKGNKKIINQTLEMQHHTILTEEVKENKTDLNNENNNIETRQIVQFHENLNHNVGTPKKNVKLKHETRALYSNESNIKHINVQNLANTFSMINLENKPSLINNECSNENYESDIIKDTVFPHENTEIDLNCSSKVSKQDFNNHIESFSHSGAGDSLIHTASNSKSNIHVQVNDNGDMYSEFKNFSLPPVEPDKKSDELIPACILTDRAKNRMKIMSSEYSNRLNSSTSSLINPCNRTNMPMTECMRNKLKVMSSEYHSRLSTISNEKILEKKILNSPLTECQKNKLKVMSSEYHMRLNDYDKLKIETNLSRDSVQNEIIAQKDEVINCNFSPNVESNEKINSQLEISSMNDREANLIDVVQIKSDMQIGENEDKKINFTNNDNLVDSCINSMKKSMHSELLLNNYHSSYDKLMLGNVISFNDVKIEVDSVQNIDVTSLVCYLSQSISIPLKIQTRLLNEAVIRIFIEEECYLDHLIALKNFLLLRKPEFTLSLTNFIFKMIENVNKPYYLLNNYVLSFILQQSLLITNSKEIMKYGKKLSFIIEDIPESFNLKDIQVLNCFSLNYSVEWPLNILITEEIMKKYTKVFKFLMQLELASWVLKKDFIYLKNFKIRRNLFYTQLQLFRHNMTQIIRIFKEFISRECFENIWKRFVRQLTTTNINLELLYASHLKYINKIIQRCLLCDLSSSCYYSILKLFSTVLKYHQLLRIGTWRQNIEVNLLNFSNFKNIQEIYTEFSNILVEIQLNLKSLVYHKQQIYLEPLYLELCNNFKMDSRL